MSVRLCAPKCARRMGSRPRVTQWGGGRPGTDSYARKGAPLLWLWSPKPGAINPKPVAPKTALFPRKSPRLRSGAA